MKKRIPKPSLLLGGWCILPALVLLLFLACPSDYEFTPVNDQDLSAQVPYPAKGGNVTKKLAETASYTGKIEWLSTAADDTIVPFTGSIFAGGTVYHAVLTLTAKTGYTFGGVGPNSFTHYRGVAENPPGNSDNPDLIVRVTFPKTSADGDTLITVLDLDSLFGPPVKNIAPAAPGGSSEYDFTVFEWRTEDDEPFNDSAFAPETVYKAYIEVAPKTGFSLEGIEPGGFTYYGASVSAEYFISGGICKVRITITFPSTAKANEKTVINHLNLNSLVTAPVWGAEYTTATGADEQYTGVIEWKKMPEDSTFTGTFATLTVYKAVITLTAAEGYTFTGVDTFTYNGATSITNTVTTDDGDPITVTITFPQTGYNLGHLTQSDISIKACCYANGAGHSKMHDGNTAVGNSWLYAYDNNNANDALIDLSTYPDYAWTGHPSVFGPLGLPNAHIFNIDLLAQKTNIVSFEFFNRYRDDCPYRVAIYISDSDFGVNATASGVTSLGVFEIAAPASSSDRAWRSIDLRSADGAAISGRYIQIRIEEDWKNTTDGFMEPSISEVHIGVDNG
jgi:hypothetical protein